jgi:putative phosphoesterase
MNRGALEKLSLQIAVIADTHDHFPNAVAQELVNANEIWHLGDVCRKATLQKIHRLGPPLTVILGNNDHFQTWPRELTLQRNGVSFRLIHIPPPDSIIGEVDFLLHGHTHIPRDETVEGIRILNPGAIGRANKGAPPSYAWLTVTPDGRVEWSIVRLK